jgi:hypothetical protein
LALPGFIPSRRVISDSLDSSAWAPDRGALAASIGYVGWALNDAMGFGRLGSWAESRGLELVGVGLSAASMARRWFERLHSLRALKINVSD